MFNRVSSLLAWTNEKPVAYWSNSLVDIKIHIVIEPLLPKISIAGCKKDNENETAFKTIFRGKSCGSIPKCLGGSDCSIRK